MRGRAARLAALALAALPLACARIVPPGGGPEDRDAPRVVALAPDSGAVRVAPDQPLRIEFSESMDRSSVADWLQVSPWPGRLTLRWEGRELHGVPETGWQPATTYTVLLGSRAADRHRNCLADPLFFAFATGDSLDPGEVRGRVLTRSLSAEAVPVFVFDGRDGSPGTPDPLRALRTGETGKEGTFAVRFVPADRPLRLAALHDRNGNRAFDADEDLWGFATEAVRCGDSARAAEEVEIFLVYDDEPGDLSGAIGDSACAGYVPPQRWRARADSLTAILEGRVDAMGFARAPGDTTPAPVLSPQESDSLRLELDRTATGLAASLTDSARCSGGIWVTALAADSTVAGEARCSGAFTISELAAGTYRLTAFRDLDGDGRWQAGEPRGDLPLPVELLAGRRLEELDWEIGIGSPAPGGP